ncbi:MAG TPA: hypothetical protein VF557_18365 [Jatrophihabitans sp.]|jgi:hypothetical protein|uniref:hypothetical protein n=1 Tax=Jatrophihabitans sp. TaxID=1932789 RepID=UPI002F16138E
MSHYESPSRGHGIEEGLAARVYDPLWLLGRQWQFGEFRHENAASPAWVEAVLDVHPLDQWRTADGENWQTFASGATPLERLVEEHGGGPSPRLRLEGGLRLRRMLAAAGAADDLAAFVARCPFPSSALLDQGDSAVRRALPDGAGLAGCLQRLSDAGTVEEELAALRAGAAVTSTAAQLASLAGDWLEWWRAQAPELIPADQDCWDEHRLEHAFALRATGLPSVELRASEYHGGRLDWSAVDAFEVDGPAPGEARRIKQSGIPAPARFGGMPAPRFWEMEDARFDPGSVDAAPIDLGRLMLVGYATVYGNDWFVVPIRVPVSTLSQVSRFDVHDVFGGTSTLTAIDPDVDGWNLFSLSAAEQPLTPGQERPTSPWFFLTPAIPGSLESQPTDVVVLLRDEMANLAWAVESIVCDDQGRARDRFAEWAARDIPPPVITEHPAYHVDSDVPDHWFPLMPEQLSDQESIRLRLVPLSRIVNGEVSNLQPAGTLLPSGNVWLHEEEVPRSGVQVVRTWQHARWHDGSRHLWQARRKLTGSGEGSSGLRFDQVDKT